MQKGGERLRLRRVEWSVEGKPAMPFDLTKSPGRKGEPRARGGEKRWCRSGVDSENAPPLGERLTQRGKGGKGGKKTLSANAESLRESRRSILQMTAGKIPYTDQEEKKKKMCEEGKKKNARWHSEGESFGQSEKSRE